MHGRSAAHPARRRSARSVEHPAQHAPGTHHHGHREDQPATGPAAHRYRPQPRPQPRAPDRHRPHRPGPAAATRQLDHRTSRPTRRDPPAQHGAAPGRPSAEVQPAPAPRDRRRDRPGPLDHPGVGRSPPHKPSSATPVRAASATRQPSQRWPEHAHSQPAAEARCATGSTPAATAPSTAPSTRSRSPAADLRAHPQLRSRRTAEGKTAREICRALKRYTAHRDLARPRGRRGEVLLLTMTGGLTTMAVERDTRLPSTDGGGRHAPRSGTHHPRPRSLGPRG